MFSQKQNADANQPQAYKQEKFERRLAKRQEMSQKMPESMQYVDF